MELLVEVKAVVQWQVRLVEACATGLLVWVPGQTKHRAADAGGGGLVGSIHLPGES